MPASPPPLVLLNSAWLPVIIAFYIRVVEIFRAVPGLVVTSWWRSPATNLDAGGDEHSQHLFALGMDFAGSREALRSVLELTPGLGLISVDFGGYVHVQLFPKGALARVGIRFPT